VDSCERTLTVVLHMRKSDSWKLPDSLPGTEFDSPRDLILFAQPQRPTTVAAPPEGRPPVAKCLSFSTLEREAFSTATVQRTYVSRCEQDVFS
jgi:hypothetical protein